MSTGSIEIGTRLEIWPLTSLSENADKPAACLVSQVLESPLQDQLTIAIPSRGSDLVVWPAGQVIRMEFIQPNSCCWIADARIQAQGVTDLVRSYTLSLLGQPVRKQRRSWFRLPVSLDVRFRFHHEDEQAEDEPQEPGFAGMTRDLSGGGASFVTDYQDLEGGLLDIELMISPNRIIRAKGRIARKEVLQGKPKRCHVAIQFTEIARGDQDDIVRYVFREQVRSKKVRG